MTVGRTQADWLSCQAIPAALAQRCRHGVAAWDISTRTTSNRRPNGPRPRDWMPAASPSPRHSLNGSSPCSTGLTKTYPSCRSRGSTGRPSGDAGFDAVSLSGRLSFLRVRAAKRLQLALRDALRDGSIGEVDLTEASFAGPAVLTASLGGTSIRRPKLVSLVQADTTNLTVAGLDLSNCRFLGAINLERLRIDGPLLLGEAPGWWRARRRVLWEEGELRDWPGWATPDRHDGPEAALHRGEQASRLQAVYRELRKGREDAKDEPGAADFYYGEMEMRRQAARGVER